MSNAHADERPQGCHRTSKHFHGRLRNQVQSGRWRVMLIFGQETTASAMKQADALELRRVTIEVTKHVFSTYSMDLELFDIEQRAFSCAAPVTAFIGFGGKKLRGTLAIVAPFSLLRSRYPLALRADPEAALDVLDFAGELANQLLGSFKNQLLTWGIELYASPPKAILSKEVLRALFGTAAICELHFKTSANELGIWLDALSPEGTELFGTPGAGPLPPNPSDVILF